VTTSCERVWLFLFPRTSDAWLTILRTGLGIQLSLYCLSARPGWMGLLGSDQSKFTAPRISEALLSLESPIIPRVSWLLDFGGHLGIPRTTVLWMIWSILLLSAVLLGIGLFCRPAAVTAWFLHLACIKSSEVFAYGMDSFLTIGLFYLMLSPLPDSQSLESHLWKPTPRDPRLIGFFRRVLQLHLCVIYFFSGLAKCLGSDWWNGINLWAALTRPPFNILDPAAVASWQSALPPAGITICILEIGYPIFIGWRRTRAVWLGCVVAMHVGVAIAMGMYLFSTMMIILNLAAFGPSWVGRPHRVGRRSNTAKLA
jgi:hypothetical protein